MFERLYFPEVTVHLNFRYGDCFEQEVLKLYSIDSLWDARSSHRGCSVRKGVFRNFTEFTPLPESFLKESCKALLVAAFDAYVT